MIIDMHVHTNISGDSSATVEQYCSIIQKFRQYYPFDGIVLTEHCRYDREISYQNIGEKYGLSIFQGVEADTDLGHLLLYGITDRFLEEVDISRKNLSSQKVIKTINDCGGIGIPAHPFRASNYGSALMNHDEALNDIKVIEELNGSNTSDEDSKATALIRQTDIKGIGGSDAHYVNRLWFLNCATEFFNGVHTIEDLVEALRQGDFRAVSLDSSALGEF